jgi:hypothetical protein
MFNLFLAAWPIARPVQECENEVMVMVDGDE